jgi:RNA polymerase sigma-70 factor (ECF subfamily)
MANPSLDDQFMDLLTAHQGQVFGYIYAAVRNLDDAEELYQQTSLVLWRKFSDYRLGSDFARWACKAAKYEILHFQRNKRRSAIHFSEQALSNLAEVQTSSDDEARRFQQEFLAECVDELSPDDQQLVRLCYGQQHSIKQVADTLQRSAQTLYNSLSRIRHVLFDCVRLKLTREQQK